MNLMIIGMICLSLGMILGWAFATLRGRYQLQRVEGDKEVLQEKLELFKQTQASLLEQFKGISAQALKENHEIFLHMAQERFERFHEKSVNVFEKKEIAVADMIKPVKEALQKVDVKIEELEKTRVGAYSSLKEQIVMLIETQNQLRTETSSLAKALRTPHVRGRWGEIQLRRVVELAGMLDHCDFFEQESISKEENRFRPDMIVRLPGNKHVIVDAKAPLEAYLDAIECEKEEDRKNRMRDHARHIRNHMTHLSRKVYWDQLPSTPDFVILFLPGETFFSAALEQDPSLIEAGVDQKVLLATPTTLITLLRAISYGWRQESLSKNAEQISALGKELYKRIMDMGGHFNKLGKSLEQSVDAYNKAIGSLESRVLVSARRFKDLEAIEKDQDIVALESIDHIPRQLQASEMSLNTNTPV